MRTLQTIPHLAHVRYLRILPPGNANRQQIDKTVNRELSEWLDVDAWTLNEVLLAVQRDPLFDPHNPKSIDRVSILNDAEFPLPRARGPIWEMARRAYTIYGVTPSTSYTHLCEAVYVPEKPLNAPLMIDTSQAAEIYHALLPTELRTEEASTSRQPQEGTIFQE